MAVSRDQLYKEVWAEPMTKVAAKYNVSSSFLARVCERLKVNGPKNGPPGELGRYPDMTPAAAQLSKLTMRVSQSR